MTIIKANFRDPCPDHHQKTGFEWPCAATCYCTTIKKWSTPLSMIPPGCFARANVLKTNDKDVSLILSKKCHRGGNHDVWGWDIVSRPTYNTVTAKKSGKRAKKMIDGALFWKFCFLIRLFQKLNFLIIFEAKFYVCLCNYGNYFTFFGALCEEEDDLITDKRESVIWELIATKRLQSSSFLTTSYRQCNASN